MEPPRGFTTARDARASLYASGASFSAKASRRRLWRGTWRRTRRRRAAPLGAGEEAERRARAAVLVEWSLAALAWGGLARARGRPRRGRPSREARGAREARRGRRGRRRPRRAPAPAARAVGADGDPMRDALRRRPVLARARRRSRRGSARALGPARAPLPGDVEAARPPRPCCRAPTTTPPPAETGRERGSMWAGGVGAGRRRPPDARRAVRRRRKDRALRLRLRRACPSPPPRSRRTRPGRPRRSRGSSAQTSPPADRMPRQGVRQGRRSEIAPPRRRARCRAALLARRRALGPRATQRFAVDAAPRSRAQLAVRGARRDGRASRRVTPRNAFRARCDRGRPRASQSRTPRSPRSSDARAPVVALPTVVARAFADARRARRAAPATTPRIVGEASRVRPRFRRRDGDDVAARGIANIKGVDAGRRRRRRRRRGRRRRRSSAAPGCRRVCVCERVSRRRSTMGGASARSALANGSSPRQNSRRQPPRSMNLPLTRGEPPSAGRRTRDEPAALPSRASHARRARAAKAAASAARGSSTRLRRLHREGPVGREGPGPGPEATRAEASARARRGRRRGEADDGGLFGMAMPFRVLGGAGERRRLTSLGQSIPARRPGGVRPRRHRRRRGQALAQRLVQAMSQARVRRARGGAKRAGGARRARRRRLAAREPARRRSFDAGGLRTTGSRWREWATARTGPRTIADGGAGEVASADVAATRRARVPRRRRLLSGGGGARGGGGGGGERGDGNGSVSWPSPRDARRRKKGNARRRVPGRRRSRRRFRFPEAAASSAARSARAVRAAGTPRRARSSSRCPRAANRRAAG